MPNTQAFYAKILQCAAGRYVGCMAQAVATSTAQRTHLGNMVQDHKNGLHSDLELHTWSGNGVIWRREFNKILQGKFLKMNSLRFLMIAIIMTFLPMKVLADLTVDMVLENTNEPVVQAYLNGVTEALSFANAHIQNKGSGPKMFCAPNTIIFSRDLSLAALKTGNDKYGDMPPALLIMFGMAEMFPCN